MSPARGSSRPKAEPATATAPEVVQDGPEKDERTPLDIALAQYAEAEGYPINLASKTAAIMAEIHRVAKTGRNDAQGYDFAREGDIADMVRALLARYRVGFKGTLIGLERSDIVSQRGANGTEARVRIQFTLTCADSGEVEETYWEGDATDYTDKAVPKAITAAKKSWLVFRFLVSTGDPEPDESGQEYRRGSSAHATQEQRQTEQRQQATGPDLRPSTPAQRQRLFGLGKTVPFLVDATTERVSQEILHNLVAWTTRKDEGGPVTSLPDLNRTQIDRVFKVMERCAADVGAAAATDRAMSHWIETGEDLPRSAAEEAPQPADTESDAPSAPPPVTSSDPQFDASRLAEEARKADEAAEAGDVEPEGQPEPMEGEEPLPFDASGSPPIPDGGVDELDFSDQQGGDDYA